MSPVWASLLDLPFEILQLILDDISECDVLSLSRVSRRLNRVTLERYFKNHCISYEPSTQSCTSITLDGSSWWELLPALRKAMFVLSIERLEAKLGCTGQSEYRNACELELLLSNVSLVHIEEVVLDFSHVHFRMSRTHTPPRLRRAAGNTAHRPLRWAKVLRGITKAITRRSCKTLTIQGGDVEELPSPIERDGDMKSLNRLWYSSPRDGVPLSLIPHQQFLRSLFRMISRSGDRRDETPFDLWPLTTLRTLHISYSPLIISHPFLYWIISSINLSPLTVLSFSQLGISTLAWAKLLSCLTIPTLSSISIASSELRTADLFSFLARHPSIKDLNLCGGRLCMEESRLLPYSFFLTTSTYRIRCTSPFTRPFYPLVLPLYRIRPIFPQLVALSGTPNHVIYLLGARSLDGLHVLPNLTSISIESFGDMRIGPIDCALDAISQSELKCINLTLRIYMGESNFINWLQNVVEPIGNDMRHYWKSLYCVKILHIQAINDVAIGAIQFIPHWLAKFPAVEKVALSAPWFEWMGIAERNTLEAEIMALCPHLEEIRLSGPV
jgi:hypothetical protein